MPCLKRWEKAITKATLAVRFVYPYVSSLLAAMMKSFYATRQSYGSTTEFRGSHKPQNAITFTCKLHVVDKKRKSRRNTTAPAQTTHLSLQPWWNHSCAGRQSYASKIEGAHSQLSQKFGTSSISKFSGGRKYQNPITFTSRLNIVDIKRKSRRSASTITGPS